MYIVANIFSFIGSVALIWSTFAGTKRNMLLFRVLDTSGNALGNFFIGSYSGMASNLISLVRNILNIKGKISFLYTALISLSVLVVGISVNTRGLIGFLPPIASVEYTIWSMKGSTAQSLRYALLINITLWLIYDINIGLVPAIIADIITLLTAIYNILKFIRGGHASGEVRSENQRIKKRY